MNHTVFESFCGRASACSLSLSATRSRSGRVLVSLAVAAVLLLTRTDVALAATAVPLGTASSFAVLGGTPGVTNTGATVVVGDLGVSPAASVTGFPPGIVVGTIHAANAVAASAQFDSAAAYGLLAAQACTVTFAVPTDLAGMTLAPGVYCFASSATNTGLLNLDAGGNTSAVWLFRTATTLITTSGASVVPINGGQACNVYWQVGSSATLGTTTSFAGNILALTSITVATGSTLSGRALAQTGAVTLDASSITVCSLGATNPAVIPALAKSFSPNRINAAGVSTLTVTLSNPNPSVATLTAPLVDTLPSGVLVAPFPNGTSLCGGGTTVIATPGTNTLSLPAGRTIPANGSCTISVSVTSALVGNYVNVLPVNALQTSNGNNPAPAVALLTILAALPPVATPAVPTLSDWMVVTLAALMLIVGGVATRRSAR